jgi:hypothetical protein
VDLHAVVSYDDTAFDTAAADAQIVSVPPRGEVQLAAKFLGYLVDATSCLFDTECVFSSYFQRAAARPRYPWQLVR